MDGNLSLDDLARGLVVPPARSDRPRASEPVPTFVTVRIDRVLRELRG
ncbi:MAG: hypothetical protein R2715_21050 [Ilumatobacteraceae bacterium]